jgi:hypothetical protein
LRCLIQSFYQSLIKTNHHVKQNNQKKEFMEIHVVPALVAFFYVSSKCRGAEKAKKPPEYNWNESGTSNQSLEFDRERIKC